MQIPVAHLTQYGTIIGSIVYDTDKNAFIDSKKQYQRDLPLQDYTDCTVINNSCITLVGKVAKRNTLVCCFGDNFCYELDKQFLSKYKISNAHLDQADNYYCIDGSLQDLSYLYPDGNIRFLNHFYANNQSSKGVARKFSALYRNKRCIVKFSKTNNEDLYNEQKYKQISDLLGVNCCDTYLSEYYGKKCVISIFEYDRNDIYISFKNLNKSIDIILDSFCKEDKLMFDKYMLLDYILLQQDRHFSNLAVVNDRLYPLFDNGECLGLGAISYFSSNFRTYIERLDKDYLRTLFHPDQRIFQYLNVTQANLVKREMTKIW